jgi:hypothetical protein
MDGHDLVLQVVFAQTSIKIVMAISVTGIQLKYCCYSLKYILLSIYLYFINDCKEVENNKCSCSTAKQSNLTTAIKIQYGNIFS